MIGRCRLRPGTAQVPPGRQHPVREHEVQIRPGEQNPRDDPPESGLVLEFDMLANLRRSLRQGREGVGVLPFGSGALRLDIGKAMFGDVSVHRRPPQWQQSHPQRELRDRSLSEWFDVVQHHDRRRGCEAFERTGITMEVTDGTQWGGDVKSKIEDGHG